MKSIINNKFAKLFILSVILVCLVYMIMPKRKEAPLPKQNEPVSIQSLIKNDETPEPQTTPSTTSPTTQSTPETPKEKEPEKLPEKSYPAGKTVDEAWETYIELVNDNPRDVDYGIYTEMSKIILKNTENRRHEYYGNPASIYVDKPYKVSQKGNYAVVNFEDPNTKDNLPFFFCKTPEGWKFDLVYQRKLTRFAQEAIVGIKRNISPYNALLRRYPFYHGFDIPLEIKDIYRVSDDAELAKKTRELEALANSPEMTPGKVLELARIYTITSMNAKALPVLEQLKTNFPDKADVYKYAAMVHINSQSDYKAAIAEMEKYVQLKPAYEYGHNFLGFLYSNAHEYKKAQGEFERALQINRLSCYASSKLAPVYYNLYNSLSDMREEKYEYLEKYKNMLKTAANNCTGADYERYVMLIQWKHKVNALPENMQKAPPTPNLPKAPDYDTN
ncbi:MAG: hypothetical protein GX568_01010 [Candidatus Gastranaerophilales bacterium]|nr:hypothetical protein [Candidatus Gastranaerophilales bacterium]